MKDARFFHGDLFVEERGKFSLGVTELLLLLLQAASYRLSER
ncbi:hypothetical protein [Alistipes sp.]